MKKLFMSLIIGLGIFMGFTGCDMGNEADPISNKVVLVKSGQALTETKRAAIIDGTVSDDANIQNKKITQYASVTGNMTTGTAKLKEALTALGFTSVGSATGFYKKDVSAEPNKDQYNLFYNNDYPGSNKTVSLTDKVTVIYFEE